MNMEILLKFNRFPLGNLTFLARINVNFWNKFKKKATLKRYYLPKCQFKEYNFVLKQTCNIIWVRKHDGGPKGDLFCCLTTNAEHGLQSLNCMLFKKAKTRILVSHIVKEYSDYTNTIHFKQVLLWSPIMFSDSNYITSLFQCKVVFLELTFW